MKEFLLLLITLNLGFIGLLLNSIDTRIEQISQTQLQQKDSIIYKLQDSLAQWNNLEKRNLQYMERLSKNGKNKN